MLPNSGGILDFPLDFMMFTVGLCDTEKSYELNNITLIKNDSVTVQ